MSTALRVCALKYDGRPHYSWNTFRLLSRDGTVVVARPGPRELEHHSKGRTFTFESAACELFWPGLPFSIGLSLDHDDDRVRCYCNVHEPAQIEPTSIRFVDLDLDVVRRDGEPEIVDHDEFEQHRRSYGYPERYAETVPAVAERLRGFLAEEPACDPHRLADLVRPIQRRRVLRDRELGTVSALDAAVRRRNWPAL